MMPSEAAPFERRESKRKKREEMGSPPGSEEKGRYQPSHS